MEDTQDPPLMATDSSELDPLLLLEENKALDNALVLSRKRLRAMRDIGNALAGRVDLDGLLHEIVTRVSDLCDCDRASLFLVDEDRQELWSRVALGIHERNPAGEGGADGEPAIGRIRLPLGTGVAGNVAQTGVALNLSNAYDDKRFNPEVDQVTGYKTENLVCVPILNAEGRPMGVLEALNKRGGPFTHEDERLLEAISHQLALALSDALRFEELKEKKLALDRRVAELDLLVDVERAMAEADSIEGVLDAVVERAKSLIDAGGASVALVDPKTGGVRFRAASGKGSDQVLDVVLPPERGLVGVCIDTGQPIIVDDAAADSRHDKALAIELGFEPGPLLAVPILLEGNATGAIEVMRLSGSAPFTADDQRILSLLAGRLGEAMAVARQREKSRQDDQLKTIGQLLSGIVHDFKTPMTVIAGYVQLMAMADDAKEREKTAEIVLKQTDLMTSMTKELLQFARGERDILVRKVYVHAFMRDVEEMLSQLFKDRAIDIDIDLGYRGAGRFDEVKMKRAIMNLARNAGEAMGENGKLRLAVSQTGDQIEFAVSDTGPGLPAEMEGRLFESFATHGKEEGTGLGLAVVKKIIDDHQGEVRVESKADAGCTFRLRLPL